MERRSAILVWALVLLWLLPGARAAERAAQEVTLLDTFNTIALEDGPTQPTAFTVKQPHRIITIANRHWHGGRGAAPGTISLVGLDGKTYGPWPAQGGNAPGPEGPMKNGIWTCTPGETIPAGTYVVVDSDPRTWARNAASRQRGLTKVTGLPVGFTGAWETNYGRVELEEAGGAVKGTYSQGRGRIEGAFSPDGKTLEGKWAEGADLDRTDRSGAFSFRIAANSQAFSGRWWTGAAKDGAGELWGGVRVTLATKAARANGFIGRWNTRFGELVIHEDEKGVHGRYPFNGGTLEATLAEDRRTLTGTWTENASRGRLRFGLSEDGRRFEGQYWTGDEMGAAQPWNGERVDPPLDMDF